MNNNNRSTIIRAIAIFLIIVLALVGIKFGVEAVRSLAVKEPVSSRVLESGVLRACWINTEPGSYRNKETGEMEGIFVRALETAGIIIGLKVEWVQEVYFDTMIQALNDDVCDIIGSPSWNMGGRGRDAELLTPLYYSVINGYVRAGDNRFVNNLTAINDPAVTIAVIADRGSKNLVMRIYPAATIVELPVESTEYDMLQAVLDGRADVAFTETNTANVFAVTYPNRLTNITADKPVILFGNVMLVKKYEYHLKEMLDNALNQQLRNGAIASFIRQYQRGYESGYYQVDLPYIVPNQ